MRPNNDLSDLKRQLEQGDLDLKVFEFKHKLEQGDLD